MNLVEASANQSEWKMKQINGEESDLLLKIDFVFFQITVFNLTDFRCYPIVLLSYIVKERNYESPNDPQNQNPKN